jgi:hypothetical protein
MAGALLCLLADPIAAFGFSQATSRIPKPASANAPLPGFSGWIAAACGDHSLLYGLIVVLIMAILGLALGYGMDFLIRLTGIDLGRLEHHE